MKINKKALLLGTMAFVLVAAIALALVMNWWSTNVDEGTELDIALMRSSSL